MRPLAWAAYRPRWRFSAGAQPQGPPATPGRHRSCAHCQARRGSRSRRRGRAKESAAAPNFWRRCAAPPARGAARAVARMPTTRRWRTTVPRDRRASISAGRRNDGFRSSTRSLPRPTKRIRKKHEDRPLRPVSPVTPRRITRWPHSRPADQRVPNSQAPRVSGLSYGPGLHPTRPKVNVGSAPPRRRAAHGALHVRGGAHTRRSHGRCYEAVIHRGLATRPRYTA
jgi:hypothetical protein